MIFDIFLQTEHVFGSTLYGKYVFGLKLVNMPHILSYSYGRGTPLPYDLSTAYSVNVGLRRASAASCKTKNTFNLFLRGEA